MNQPDLFGGVVPDPPEDRKVGGFDTPRWQIDTQVAVMTELIQHGKSFTVEDVVTLIHMDERVKLPEDIDDEDIEKGVRAVMQAFVWSGHAVEAGGGWIGTV